VEEHGTALPAGSAAVDTGTAALGLPGFVVLAAGAYGGELELLVAHPSYEVPAVVAVRCIDGVAQHLHEAGVASKLLRVGGLEHVFVVLGRRLPRSST